MFLAAKSSYKIRTRRIGPYKFNNSHLKFCLSDIDECAALVDPCNAVANSACKNTNGSYSCLCKDGFVKNGPVCEGKI